MTKRECIADLNSCWNRAELDEPVFVLLARDKAFDEAIRKWMYERILLGKMAAGDAEYESIKAMLRQARQWRKTRQDKMSS